MTLTPMANEPMAVGRPGLWSFPLGVFRHQLVEREIHGG
jgi:hypothetical protein